MDKQAFLIMAHNNIEQLKVLLKSIDNNNVDIFLHIDKKWIEFDPSLLNGVIKQSSLFFTKRISVNWGGVFAN